MTQQQLQSPRPGNIRPHPFVVVRVTGLPLTMLQGLRFEQTLERIDELLALERWLITQAVPLSDALYLFIGTLSAPQDKRLRYHLLALRHAIFQHKLPKPQDSSDEVFSALHGELGTSVRTWLQCLQRQYALLRQSEHILEAELAEKRNKLKQLAQHETFLQALLLASKDLYLDVQRWLHDDSASAQHIDRKLEHGIMSYLARMAAKTSPYSTFTGTARGFWDENTSSSEAISYQVKHWRRQSVVELNKLITHQLAAKLAGWQQIRPYLTLRVNPTIQKHEQSIQLLSSTEQGGEAILHLTYSATLRTILCLVRNASDPSLGTILQILTQADQGGRADEIARFLDQLIAKGVLQLDYNIPDQSLDYPGQLLEKLRAISQPDEHVRNIEGLLSILQANLAHYAQAEQASTRFEVMTQIQHCLKTIYEQLELSNKQGYQQPPAKNAFYENVIITDLHLGCTREKWQKVFDDLGCFQKLVGLYDPLLPTQLALRTFFVDHYGSSARVRLLDFYETFCKARRRETVTGSHSRIDGAVLHRLVRMPSLLPAIDLDEMPQIVAMRRKVSHWLNSQPLDEQNVRQIDRTQLADIICDFPPFVRVPHSLAYYCQVLVRNGEPHLIINSVQSGFGRSLGRLHYIERQAGLPDMPQSEAYFYQQPATEAAHTLEDEALLVSIQGVFGTNINLRIDPTLYEIAYPGYVSERPQEEQLPFSDLSVVDDPNTHRLRLFSERLQRTLLPVHMGLMADFWLPPMYRFLIRAFSEAPTYPWWNLLLIDDADTETRIRIAGTIYSPRLCLGRLCIGRAYWLIPFEEIPQRDGESSAFDYLLRIQRWREQLCLPQQCYIRVNPGPPDDESAMIRSPSPDKTSKDRKPVYIDFRNYFSVGMFERLAARSKLGILVEEALPGIDDLVLTDGENSYVSEFIFELTKEREQ